MKMPEKHDLLAAILAAKEQNCIRANPCVYNMAYLHEYNGVYAKTVIDYLLCAIIA